MIATLTTERLILRPMVQSDAPAVQREFATWDIIQHLSTRVPWPYPQDGAESFLRDVLLPSMGDGRVMAWAIVRKGGPDEPMGMLEYRIGPDVVDNRGFWLGVRHQGHGYMTEAVVAFQDHIFFDLGVDEIYVHNAVGNLASRRVKERTGAMLVGMSEIPHRSGEVDAERWVVTREAWAAHRGRV